MANLTAEFEYYKAHQAELVQHYNGRFIVIKNEQVIGNYPDKTTAINEAEKEHKLGTFLVQKVEPGSDSYTQTFHSRVSF